MMVRSEVALIIPALNESITIGETVRSVAQYGTAIVVDDGSSDDTEAVAKAAGATVVKHPRNRGYDAALASGFAKAAEMGFPYADIS